MHSVSLKFLVGVLSFSDYYPFGMQMPGRNASTGDYRYGFQGQETDDEVTGSESHVAFKYRMHDARLGRFLSLDPLAPDYSHNSPYAFSENTTIAFIELEGLEKLYAATGGQVLDTKPVAEGEKMPIYLADETAEDFNPDDPWATAFPLTYSLDIEGTKLREDHPLQDIGWEKGGQVYFEDIINMRPVFDDVMTEAVPEFLAERNDYWIYGEAGRMLAKDAWFTGQVGTGNKYDLKD
jgi:RHS repeat-associated protein